MSGGVVRWIAQAAWVVALAAAAAWSVRVGVADGWARKETAAGLTRALEWTPGRAEYHFQLALLLAARDADQSLAELGRAVELKPSDSRSWIELGLRHEADGEYARAEQCLLRAAREDQQYLPRWTLTNYYYRRGDTQRFWEWARLAAQTIPGDSRPLIRLCGRVVEDGNLMERLASCDGDVTAAYLAQLMEVGRGDLAGKVTLKVLEANRIEDLPLLLATFDRMVEQGRAEQALEIWNGLSARHRIPFGALDPAQNRSLTNGEFAVAPSLAGLRLAVARSGGDQRLERGASARSAADLFGRATGELRGLGGGPAGAGKHGLRAAVRISHRGPAGRQRPGVEAERGDGRGERDTAGGERGEAGGGTAGGSVGGDREVGPARVCHAGGLPAGSTGAELPADAGDHAHRRVHQSAARGT